MISGFNHRVAENQIIFRVYAVRCRRPDLLVHYVSFGGETRASKVILSLSLFHSLSLSLARTHSHTRAFLSNFKISLERMHEHTHHNITIHQTKSLFCCVSNGRVNFEKIIWIVTRCDAVWRSVTRLWRHLRLVTLRLDFQLNKKLQKIGAWFSLF